MQQTKEKAPRTVAAVQDAKDELLDHAHHKDSMENVKKQVLELSNNLDFADTELGEVHLVLQDVLQQIYEEIGPKSVHTEYAQTRFLYYGAILGMICRSLFDLKTDVAGITEAAGKLSDEVSG